MAKLKLADKVIVQVKLPRKMDQFEVGLISTVSKDGDLLGVCPLTCPNEVYFYKPNELALAVEKKNDLDEQFPKHQGGASGESSSYPHGAGWSEQASKTGTSEAGVKFDEGKSPISLIPSVAITGMADVFAFGAKKYGRHNFRKGMAHSRVLDAAFRHILAIMNGEDLDPESGKPHWAHALCCLAMYAFFKTASVGEDDRYKQITKG